MLRKDVPLHPIGIIAELWVVENMMWVNPTLSCDRTKTTLKINLFVDCVLLSVSVMKHLLALIENDW
jgi:hypothetical protein